MFALARGHSRDRPSCSVGGIALRACIKFFDLKGIHNRMTPYATPTFYARSRFVHNVRYKVTGLIGESKVVERGYPPHLSPGTPPPTYICRTLVAGSG